MRFERSNSFFWIYLWYIYDYRCWLKNPRKNFRGTLQRWFKWLHCRTFAFSWSIQYQNFFSLFRFGKICTHLPFKCWLFFASIFRCNYCEMSFSAMNRITSPERNKLRDILMDLLLLYDITPEEKAKLDINKLAYDIIHNVWKYEKKNLLDPKLQQNVNQMYSMMFVWSYYIMHWNANNWLGVLNLCAFVWRRLGVFFFQTYLTKYFTPYQACFFQIIMSKKTSKNVTPCRAWLLHQNNGA